MDEGRFSLPYNLLVSGSRQGPCGVPAPCSAHFTIAFDGKKLFSAALWTKADRVIYFATPTIRPL